MGPLTVTEVSRQARKRGAPRQAVLDQPILSSSRNRKARASACRWRCLLVAAQSLPMAANPGCLRQLMILLVNPMLEDLEHMGLLTSLASALVSASPHLLSC